MIVSIFLKSHEFLIDEPQSLNFGGQYLYEFSLVNEDFIVVTRKKNEKYIPGFFNISGSECNIQLVSTIVGENGAGKSTIFDIIRGTFVKNSESFLPICEKIILVEQDGQTKILYNNIGNVMIVDEDESSSTEVVLETTLNKIFPPKVDISEYQSIYYSPYLDLKFNANYDNYDPFDISLDNYIATDLEDIGNKGPNQNGFEYGAHIELLFKNTLRQIEFFNSNLFNRAEILDFFSVPKYDRAILYFRTLKKEEDFWNTPRQFQSAMQAINNKLDEEIDHWSEIRRMDGKRVLNQLEINQYLVKRFYIKSLLQVIKRRFEERNTFLEEGYLLNDEFKNEEISGEEKFREFIKNSYINYGGEKTKIFNGELFSSFMDKVDFIIDNEINVEKVNNFSVEVSVDDLADVLRLQRDIITNLLNYYPHREQGFDKHPNLYEFLSIRPLNKNLSSGENAFLNFFSKLFDFVNSNLIDSRKRLSVQKHLVILLDEADLGFHPQWKKKFVLTLLKTLPLFFEDLSPTPQIQVVFTTHDALSLSDMTSNNISYLVSSNGKTHVQAQNFNNNLHKTFGANIIELLSDSFFLKNDLIGDFAEMKIQETIDWINENAESNKKKNRTKTFNTELEYHRKVIKIIDEKITKLKLAEMINDVHPDIEFHNSVVETEIEYLRKKLL